MKKKLLAILLAVCMVISMAPAALAADSVFTDVNAGDWFVEEVGYVYDNGLMNGVDNNKFDPNGYVTRAMMWTTLARMDDVDTAGSNPWWLEGQQWAMEEGISDGTMAEKNITREQLVTMLWRYADHLGMDVSAGEDTDLSIYTDAAAVSEWAASAMQWACSTGIINGIGSTLQPQGYATRAQLAAILYRFAKENVHTVTFMWNYGNKGVYAVVEVENGQSVGNLADPSRSGYSFAGWYTEEGVRFTLDSAVTEDVVVYAGWAEIEYVPVHKHSFAPEDTADGYHNCGKCPYSELCVPNVVDGSTITCSVCGADYVVAAEASFELEGVTIESDGAGLQSYGNVTVKDVIMNAGSPADYAVIIRGGTATLENVDVNSAGGGVGATGGAKVVFDGSGVAVDSTSTSGRYLFYAVDEGTEVTIKSGDFTFSKTLNQKRAYIYAGAGATVYIEGGNFGPASKRDGYTAGIMGDGTVIITGGTFGFDPSEWVAEGYAATKSEDTWTVAPIMMKAPLRGNALTSTQITNDPEIPDVAQIGETGYDTLADAIAAATDGDVITVVADISVDENDATTLDNSYNTFFKVEGKTITIDLNGKTVSGVAPNVKRNRVGLVGMFSTENNGHLTLRDSVGTAVVEVSTNDVPAYSLITNYEDGCTITIDGGNYRLDAASDNLLYTSPSNAFTVNGGTFVLGNVGTGKNGSPWIVNAYKSNANYVLINGGSYNSDVSNQYWKKEVQIGEGLIVQERDGMYHVIRPVLSITNQSGNEVYFDTMTEAIAAAQDGDTIVLQQDLTVDETAATEVGIAKLNSDIPADQHVTLFNVSGKSITVDLNGQRIYADVSGLPTGTALAGIFSTSDGGQLTLQDSAGTGVVEVKAGTVNVFAMIINLDHSDNSSKITIESGTYILDRSVSAMIDTRCNEGVVINGGTFKLGNVKDPGLKNGQAWTFNAKGQNTRHVIVTGGTFPADIQHQYYPFEVSMAKELALQYNAETGMYTVVPAVAYVNEQEFSGKWYTNDTGYATLAEALAAVEGPKTSWDGQVSEQEYVTPLNGNFDGIEFNEDGTITIIGDGAVLDLGGETLTFNTTNAITVKAENVVINGTGGGITVTTTDGSKATVINLESGSCTVNGGTYTANTSGAGIKSSPSSAVHTGAGTILNVENAAILATDDAKGFTTGIYAQGDAVLKNSSVIAETDYSANASGNDYGSASYGICSYAALKLYDCYTWGAHSGVMAKGDVYVDGGTYEGYGHGSFYLAGSNTTSYFYNCELNWAPMRAGFTDDGVAGTNAAGFYIGGKAQNVTAYFDNCVFNANEANSETWDEKVCPYYAIVLRNSGGEKNNNVYVSNSEFVYAKKYVVRTNGADNYFNNGVGNTFGTNVKTKYDYSSKWIETNESYAKNAQA